ncbi:MAG: hypothetical protein F4Y88_05745 [Chloroflexi bacterium]|nr:hypothetical protein [Chloroflexota bacterium]
MAADHSIDLQDVRDEIDRSLEHYASDAALNKEIGRLETKISDTKNEIITWVVGTGIAVGAVIVGAVAILLNVID